MQTTLKAITTAAMLSAIGVPALGYTYTNLGNAGGWDNINGSSTVTAVIDSGNYTVDTDSASANTALLNAFGTWDAVATATKLNFSYKADLGGNYDLFDTYPYYDTASNYTYSNITIGGWKDSAWFSSNFGSSVLAVTITGTYNGIWASDMFFNEGYTWTTTGSGGYDIETVALHELGHALGLSHQDGKGAVMGTYYSGVKRTLAQDDIDGITSLYGDGTTTGGGGKGRGGGGGGGGKGKPTKLSDYSIHITYADGSFIEVVPEPTSLALLGLGGLMLMRRRRAD